MKLASAYQLNKKSPLIKVYKGINTFCYTTQYTAANKGILIVKNYLGIKISVILSQLKLYPAPTV